MSKNTIIIGIAVGTSGGLCIFDNKNKRIAYPFESISDYQDILESIRDYAKSEGVGIMAYVEDVPNYIVNNNTDLFKMEKLHHNAGRIEGMLHGLQIPYTLITPCKWQSGLHELEGKSGVGRKRALKEIAAQRYPDLKPTLKTCDAILIAEYGRRIEQ